MQKMNQKFKLYIGLIDQRFLAHKGMQTKRLQLCAVTDGSVFLWGGLADFQNKQIAEKKRTSALYYSGPIFDIKIDNLAQAISHQITRNLRVRKHYQPQKIA